MGEAEIPWRNARHHAATWWRTVIVSDKGTPVPWEVIAPWLGHSVTTCLAHYVLSGEDDQAAARAALDLQ